MARIEGLTIAAPEVKTFLERALAFPRTVMYVNVHVLNLAASDRKLARSLRSADLVYCDGAGVQIGARLLKQHLPRRLTSTDWIDAFCETCTRNGRSIYLLGGRRGVAERAAAALMQSHPGLPMAGCHHGYFEKEGEESRRVIQRINRAHPDFLIVGLGTPVQELWVHRNRAALDVPTVWCVGAMMDFLSGTVPRAPVWMCERKLEWLHRLWLEPGRMWRRYLVGNLLFLGRMLRGRWELETVRSERTSDENRHRLPAA